MIRAFLSTLLFCITALNAVAQKASFIYLQGDKKTPFYVKLNGQMQPRYGKNYCIIPELTAGVANIEVLFQQNAFPAQKFAVKIPDGGERGFLIVEKSGEISLYDIQQEFYLPAGNKAEQDRLPTPNSAPVAVAATPRVTASTTVAPREKPVRETRPKTTQPKPARERPTQPVAKATESINNGEPRFIPNLSLDNGVSSTGNAHASAGCGEPLDVQSFAVLYRKALDIGEQDERLVFLNKQTASCYSPTQLRLLARVLDRDAARYTFLKNVQSRITVASRFAELEDLLSSEAYRARFRELL